MLRQLPLRAGQTPRPLFITATLSLIDRANLKHCVMKSMRDVAGAARNIARREARNKKS